jgi:hypothetical protein
MSSSDHEPSPPPEPTAAVTSRRKFSFGHRSRTAALSAGLLIIGAIAGAGALRVAGGPRQASFVLQPSPIASMSEWSPAAIKGQVAEVFGNKFIITDASGRALVETGREGEGGGLVKPNEMVIVQGQFERGFVHASVIQHDDGRADLVGPPKGPPPHGVMARLRDAVRP